MDADFDPEDKYSWFFGQLSRDETNCTLQNQNQNGIFLVRESKTQIGDFVLCVKEEERISHYIINRIQVAGGPPRYKIGDKEFGDMASLLNFYKTHFLDTTTLIRPAPRKRLLTKFDFAGQDPEDLPFRKGEILEVLSQDEEEWWTARNNNGQIGQIPVKYTERIESSSSHQVCQQQQPIYRNPEVTPTVSMTDKPLPAKAIVILPRNPNAYDKTQLRLEVGQIVTVTKITVDGQWYGRVDEREGKFPFTHIKFLSPSNDSLTDKAT